eukprot:147303-Rhodomonas_salina.1
MSAPDITSESRRHVYHWEIVRRPKFLYFVPLMEERGTSKQGSGVGRGIGERVASRISDCQGKSTHQHEPK